MDQAALVKKRQRESLLFKELVKIISVLQQDEKQLASLIPTRLKISDDKSHCTLYFTCENDNFIKYLETLKLYKPSIRAQLSKAVKARYTPEIVFAYDQKFQEQLELDQILDSIKDDK